MPCADASTVHQSCRKRFFVSPFMNMDLRYDFRVTVPEDRVTVSIRVGAPEGSMMNAALTGVRRDLTDRALLRLCAAIPAIGLKVIAAIHWQALRLWLKGIRFRPPPQAAHRKSAAAFGAATGNRD